MAQKRGEAVERPDFTQAVPDVYESWIKKQVEDRSRSLDAQAEEDREEDEIDAAEDLHKKARRRKRGKGAGASNP
jgi:hypothetical protein